MIYLWWTLYNYNSAVQLLVKFNMADLKGHLRKKWRHDSWPSTHSISIISMHSERRRSNQKDAWVLASICLSLWRQNLHIFYQTSELKITGTLPPIRSPMISWSRVSGGISRVTRVFVGKPTTSLVQAFLPVRISKQINLWFLTSKSVCFIVLTEVKFLKYWQNS